MPSDKILVDGDGIEADVFELSITIGNASMITIEDVSDALERLAMDYRRRWQQGERDPHARITDLDGNGVGWAMAHVDQGQRSASDREALDALADVYRAMSTSDLAVMRAAVTALSITGRLL